MVTATENLGGTVGRMSAREKRGLAQRNFKEFCLAGQILDKQGRQVDFKWTLSQKRMATLMATQQAAGKPVMLNVAKARKWGCSLLATWWCAWQMVRRPNVGVLVVVHNSASLPEFRARYQQVFRSLHPDVGCGVVQDNTRELVLDNGSFVHFRSAGTKATAQQVGRSAGYQWAHMTEIPFWCDPEQTMTAARNAIYLDGPGSGIILESTPQGAHGLFYEEYMAAKRGDSDFVAFFVAWHDVEEYSKLCSPEQVALWNRWRESGNDEYCKKAGWLPDPDKRVERYALSCHQWNWWHFWLKNQCRGDLKTMRQEYGDDDVTCFLTSGRGGFDEETMRLAAGQAEMNRAGWKWGAVRQDWQTGKMRFDPTQTVLQVRAEPVAGAQYLAIMDPALGGSNAADWTVLYIARRWAEQVELVAKYKSKTPVHQVCDDTWGLLQWYGSPVLAIECNRGDAHIHEFRTREYPRLYRRQRFNVIEGNRLEDAIGFYTSATNRGSLFAALEKYVQQGKLLGIDDDMASEMRTIVVENGKKEAAKGSTDDHVLSGGMLCFLDEKLNLESAPVAEVRQQSEIVAQLERRSATLSEAIRQTHKAQFYAPTDQDEMESGGWGDYA